MKEVPRPLPTKTGVTTFAPAKRIAGFDCPVSAGRFECIVPAGTVDDGLRAKGYATAFF